jgi:hypothetical protein
VQEGKVPPFKKSEPIPEVNDEPVKVVVADSLDELVTKSGKNGTNNLQFCRVHQFFFSTTLLDWYALQSVLS